MDIHVFTQMLQDKHFTDLQKMKYKYPHDFDVFMRTLEQLYYKPMSLCDFEGNAVVFLENYAPVDLSAVKALLRGQDGPYGMKAVEDEIVATAAIESMDLNRDSVRNILKGMAPKDEQEQRILGLKKGLEFISDPTHDITEENLHRLYQMTVGDFLAQEDRLLDGQRYRHEPVYVVSDRVEHVGLEAERLPCYMQALIAFIHEEDSIHDLIKAAIVHFYFAYLHPYFDGNGRMARLLHLWFLILRGYQSTLFIPFSSRIEKTRRNYYMAFTQVENNRKYSGRIDVTPFLQYMTQHIYRPIGQTPLTDTFDRYNRSIRDGLVTAKEAQIWRFVLSCYGGEEFSTKQIERDFGDAAYATIRNFVQKFERLGLLSSRRYGSRVKYKII